jgi:predicted GH43/DUF377 family glycosyl hydrolase
MKKTIVLFYLFLFFFLLGCSKNNNISNPSSNSSGGITLKIDPHSVPAGVALISATLTRTNFETITRNLNLISDTSADVTIPEIQVGTWHLKVDAKDNNGVINYSGETDVLVQENVVVQLNLTLNPVSSGTGSIYIFVTWGTNQPGQWIDYIGNPILTKNNNPSYPNAISSAKILYDNGIYKMWYCAIYNSAVANIWYAESQNGINWNNVGSTPVLNHGDTGSWDALSVVPSVVLKEYNTYKMYYMGCTDAYGITSIGLAISSDGIHWEKNITPVITASSQYPVGIGLTDIIKKDSLYLAYFNYSNIHSANNNKIGLATSADGINWVMYAGNPILIPTLDWETGSIHNATVIFDNNRYKMVYSNLVQQNAFGLATSADGIHFTKQTNPFYRNSSTINNYVRIAYPYYRKLNNEYRIYYTGQSASGELSINLLRIPN